MDFPRFRPSFSVYAALAILFVGGIAYCNSFNGPFIFDDIGSIPSNPTVHHLWPPGPIFLPPSDQTVAGRPLVNLTLALNYAWGGLDVRGYHAVNLLIHLLAGLTLFGVLRRTFLLPVLREKFGQDSGALALAISLLWVAHPLQTEAVTYIVQRAESLMGLFYLLTLYGFIRAVTDDSRRWYAFSLGACFLGVLCKEVMVTAPLIVLLYDRTFLSGSWRNISRKRWHLHLGLVSSWLLLAVVMKEAGSRNHTMGNIPGVSWPAYGLIQIPAIVHYLRLSVWPHPLVLDYGFQSIGNPMAVVPYGLFLLLPAGFTLFALTCVSKPGRPWPAFGFAGAWVFLILAPTSSVIPLSDAIVERRMYLPLACVIVFIVVTVYRFCGRGSVFLLVPALAALITLTLLRNQDYRSQISIWSETVARQPLNPRAHDNLGQALSVAGRLNEAVRELEMATRLQPNEGSYWENLGHAQLVTGHPEQAATDYETALKLKSDRVSDYFNLAVAEIGSDRSAEALTRLRQFCSLAPAAKAGDYARLLIWMIRAAGNDEAGASEELADSFQHQWRSGPDEPVTSEARFLLGQLNEDQLVAAAHAAGPAKEAEQLCEALYFAGMKKRIEGDNTAAAEDFRRCQATRKTESVEYMLAGAELRSGPPFSAP